MKVWRVRHLLHGSPLALPRLADLAAERWARLPPRVRSLVWCAAAVALVTGVQARVSSAEARWGGPPVRVLVGEHALAVGDEAIVRAVELPPRAVPPDAAAHVPAGARLTLALPEGAVLTDAHLSPSGPAEGLADGLRAVPIPVEEGAGVTAGGWVDVWVLGAGDEPAAQVAHARPVVEVHAAENGQLTALIGLDADEVGAATEGLALGRVLLAHAPPP